CLHQIELWDSQVHGFISLMADDALALAQTAEREILRSGTRGPLHGIPIGVKDVINVGGVRTTAASRLYKHYVPASDATVVHKLKAAGAIILGKMNTHEFAYGGPSFDLPFPPARNPWDTRRFTGGSSSGSAVGLATGMIMGSLGTDTSGSLRSPATLCGVMGLKPTYGLVSRHGCVPLAQSLDHVGPMARTAQDLAILLDAMVGYDARDPASVQRPHQTYLLPNNEPVQPVKVGVITNFFDDLPVSNETRTSIQQALAVFEVVGAHVTDVTLSSL